MSTFDFAGLINFITAIFNALKDLYEMIAGKKED
jgi:hypothetical protein